MSMETAQRRNPYLSMLQVFENFGCPHVVN